MAAFLTQLSDENINASVVSSPACAYLLFTFNLTHISDLHLFWKKQCFEFSYLLLFRSYCIGRDSELGFEC